MQRYEILGKLGDGTYGTVLKARNKETDEVVAIKQMKRKFDSWAECVTLREIESLTKLASHPHVVRVYELIRQNDSTLNFVFEFMPDGNLYELMKRCATFRRSRKQSGNSAAMVASGRDERARKEGDTMTDARIRSIVTQIMSGLAYMHSMGYFHRDIKPENLLMRGDLCKLADFGLAREIDSRPPYTDYVSTRWYRAPEVLLRSERYGPAIDTFAVGCIIGELYSLRPLFPGDSEIDQIHKEFDILGVPTAETWPEGVDLMRRMKINPSSKRGNVTSKQVNATLSRIVPTAGAEAVDLMQSLLSLNPKDRPSAKDGLQHAYFRSWQRQDESTKPRLSPRMQTPSGDHRAFETESRAIVTRGPYDASPMAMCHTHSRVRSCDGGVRDFPAKRPRYNDGRTYGFPVSPAMPCYEVPAAHPISYYSRQGPYPQLDPSRPDQREENPLYFDPYGRGHHYGAPEVMQPYRYPEPYPPPIQYPIPYQPQLTTTMTTAAAAAAAAHEAQRRKPFLPPVNTAAHEAERRKPFLPPVDAAAHEAERRKPFLPPVAQFHGRAYQQ